MTMACVRLGENRIELTLEWPTALPVTRGLTVQITDRIEGAMVDGQSILAFRPNRFRFDAASLWFVEDFKIGNNSQLRLRRGVQASTFHEAIGMGGCQTIQRMDDVSMIITAKRSGIRFRCRMAGTWA